MSSNINRDRSDNLMHDIDGATKGKILSQALPYIKRFNGKVVVVKLGGSALTNNSLSTSFADDVTWLNSVGIKVLVIHGGGPHIEKQLKKLGKKVSFFEGIRVTDPETLDIVEMVLAGNVNKEIVELINKSGGFAVGLTGQDGNILKAKKLEIKETRNDYSNVDLGLVGEIENINVQLLISLLNDNFILKCYLDKEMQKCNCYWLLNMNSSIDKQEIKQFNKLNQDWWDEHGSFSALHKITPCRINYIIQVIKKNIRNQEKYRDYQICQNLKILDIGCGGGILCEPLSRLGGKVTGIDVSENAILSAKNHAQTMGLDINYKCII